MRDDNNWMPIVGYTRVSTQTQDDNGVGRDAQEQLIRSCAKNKKYHLATIYDETASAVGEGNVDGRPELQAAIRHALSLGAPLIVAEPSRFSRSIGDLHLFETPGLKVIIASEGRALGRTRLKNMIQRAEIEAKETSRRTKARLQELKRSGVRLGNPTNLHDAQRAGSTANRNRATENRERLLNFLLAHPGSEDLSAKALVELLNRSGVLNLRSRRRPGGMPWTEGALRGPLRDTKKELRLRRELQTEDDNFLVEGMSAELQAPNRKKVPSASPPAPQQAPRKPKSAQEDPHAYYRNNPLYGRF